jgi:hypothetical protein
MSNPSPVFLFTLEEKVRPGCFEEYAECTGKLIDLIRGLDAKLTFSAFGSETGQIEYNQRINSPCDFGPMLDAWGKVHDASLEMEWGRRRLNAVEWRRFSVWERMPDLSYDPVHPEPDPAQLSYYLWKNVRVRVEKERELVQTARQIRTYLEKKNIERGYSVFRNRIGYEGPLYTIILAGQDADESMAWLQQTGRNLAFGLLPFLPQLMASVEQMTDFQGRAIPELSLETS